MALLGTFRRDTLQAWQSNNPVLADGEFALVATNSLQPKKYDYWVCGDGTTPFNDLPMSSLASSIGITGITDELGNSSSLAASQKLISEQIEGVENILDTKVNIEDLNSTEFTDSLSLASLESRIEGLENKIKNLFLQQATIAFVNIGEELNIGGVRITIDTNGDMFIQGNLHVKGQIINP